MEKETLLVSRIRERDPDAIKSVVQAYFRQVVRIARASGLPTHDADDVTQATFKTFIEIAPRFEGRSKVRTFLFGILFKKISESRRGLKRSSTMDPIDELTESRFAADGSWQHPPRPLDLRILDAELGTLIDQCLEQLPAHQHIAFALRDVVGFTSEEICEIMGVTRTNLGVLLYRGRNRLRECLEAKGVSAPSST